MSEGRFLVIVPTYNEKDNLPRKAPTILAQDERIDVLVVDDASPDGTGDLADEMASQEPRVHVLHRTSKDGLGRRIPALLINMSRRPKSSTTWSVALLILSKSRTSRA